MRWRVLGLMVGLFGCSRSQGSCAALPGIAPAPAPAPAASVFVTEVLETELPEQDDAAESAVYIDLVRGEAWEEAEQALDALSDVKKEKPAVRLLRARVAIVRGDSKTAALALTGLEKALPFITDDIERWRADAQGNVGPFEEAARYFLKQGSAKGYARAALAFEKAGLAAEARTAADKAIAAERQDAAEAPVRALRARLSLLADQKTSAIDDLRFIVLRAPASDEAPAAAAVLDTMDPGHPLTGKERMSRADRLSELGRTDDALAELESAEKAPGPPDQDEANWARAFILYKARGRYDKASALFTRLGSKSGPRQAEALFYAARARSRADLDQQAAAEYRALARRFPTSPFADDALYLAARLSLLHGAWGQAVTQYAAYLKKYPNGKQRDAAIYERALALLADHKYDRARAELRTLAGAASGGEAARLHELEGLAAARAFDREAARALWNEIVRSQPLTWAALTARARLAEMGALVPASFDAPPDPRPSEPLSYQLPVVALFYHRLGLDADADNYLRAHERDAVSSIKGREKEALCAMYGDLGRAARAYRIGLEGVSSAVLARAPSPSSEWGWRCVYPRPYAERVKELEEREALPANLIYSVMRQESAYDPQALSSARAVGLLQLMPETARRLAQESGAAFDENQLRTPAVNLDLGARYLGKMLRAFDGSVPAAAAAYNAGPRAVRRWLQRMKGIDIDLWVALIPFDETRTYVARVMSNLARYSYLEGGESAVPTIALSLPATGNEQAAEY